MSNFVNTIELLGDSATVVSLIEGTIEEFNDNVLVTIRRNAFSVLRTLKSVSLPNVTEISTNAFSSCSALESVQLSKATAIKSSAFYGCSALKSLVLRSPTVCTLSTSNVFNYSSFSSSGKGGTVYVPQALITEYQNATNWSTLYASGKCNFVAIEGSEYE